MLDKLSGVENRYIELEKFLSDPEIVKNQDVYQKYIREHAELNGIVMTFRKYKQILEELDQSLELLKDGDPAIKDLAREEVALLTHQKEDLESEHKSGLCRAGRDRGCFWPERWRATPDYSSWMNL